MRAGFFWQIFHRRIENVPDFHFRNLVTLKKDAASIKVKDELQLLRCNG